MASSSILLTKRTTGASSASSPESSWLAAHIDPVEIDIAEVAESVHGALVELLDGYAELVVLHQQGFGGETGAELDIGDRLVIGRVGEADEQFVAALPQRQHAVLADQALADGILRNAFPIQAVQVAIGDAELLGGHLDQRPALHQLGLDQVADQRLLVARGLHLGLAGGLFVEEFVQDQLLGKAAERRGIVHWGTSEEGLERDL